MMCRRFAAVLCLAILSAIAMPNTASAQDAGTPTTQAPKGDESGLTISPAIIDNTVDAGVTFTAPITLGNITQRAVPIEVTKGKLETDQSPNASNQNKYDISPWFTIDTSAFLLPAQDRK